MGKENTANHESTVITEQKNTLRMLMKLECVLGYTVNIHSPKKNSSNLHLIIQHSNYMVRFELICLLRI